MGQPLSSKANCTLSKCPPQSLDPSLVRAPASPQSQLKKKKWVDRHLQLKSSPLLQPFMSGSAAGGEGASKTPVGPGANMPSPARLQATLQAFRPGALPGPGTAGGTRGGDQPVKPLHPAAQGRRPCRKPGVGGWQVSGPGPAGSGARSPSTRVKVSFKRFCWPAA